jgi:hypothetical protein
VTRGRGAHDGRQDEWRGARPRWHVNFNITMLRLVAFGMDAHWARTRRDAAAEVSVLSLASPRLSHRNTEKQR